MRAQLGVNTCFAVKRWPRPADWGPLVRDRLGVSLVQHSLDLVDLDASPEDRSAQAEETVQAARACGLQLHSTFTGLAAYSSNALLHPDGTRRARALEWFERAVDFTARLNASGTGGHVGAFSVADWTDARRRQALWRELKSSLAMLAGAARNRGQSFFLVENLAAAREPSTMPMLRELITEGDASHVPIRLCLDVGHQCVVGTSGGERDPYAWLRGLGAAAAVIQLQQSDDEGDHHWPFTEERNAAGRIDADRVLDALEGSGADEVVLVLEVIPPFEQADDAVLEDLAVSVEHWREALARRRMI
jgi:D-erythrulose 1-phosphate 3-epimerase